MTGFVHHPQQLWWRKLLFQVHLWSGLLAVLYVVLISLSGSVLVFREEAEAALEPALRKAHNPSGQRADLIAIAERLRREYPQHLVTGVYAHESPSESIVAYLRDRHVKNSRSEPHYFHPATGAPLGQGADGSQFWSWLADLHFNLLAGRPGRIANGVGAAALLLLGATGIVIWWPGVKRWRQSLQVDFRRRWKRVNWDLHSATGFWTLSVVAMWALTGVYFAWPDEFRSVVHRISPLTVTRTPTSNPARKDSAVPVELRRLLAFAQAGSPQAAFYRLNLPVDDKSPIRLYLARETFADTDYADVYYFDQFTGAHLGTIHRGRHQSAGDVAMSWIGPLHFGTFGGVPVKVLWVILGLAPAVLAISGTLMYWNRSLSKKWAAYGSPAAARRHPESAALVNPLRSARN